LRKAQISTSGLQALNQIGASHEKYALAGIDECVADPAQQVALAAAGRTERENVAAAIEPLSAFNESENLRLGNRRDRREIKGTQSLIGVKSGFRAMPIESPDFALGRFLLEKLLQEPPRRPTFAIGLLAEFGGEPLHRW
jgi:hypothetical protein